MKNNLSSRVALSAILTFATALIAITPASAWGPERQTYENNQPSDHVTFNSITNNAGIGDERNFVRVREANTDNIFDDTAKVEPGKEYEVYIYYHNNAASNLNASGKGIANGVKVSSAYPTKLNPGENGMVSGIITATDADPDTVWDEAYLTTDYNDVVLRYKQGTATIHNAGSVNGSVLSDELFTRDGTYIGINVLDGRIPGCAEYSGYITYTLVAENPDTSLEKQISLDGENWSKNVNAKPGEYVTYKVEFKNTGNTDITNAIFKDTHDNGLTLRTGSIKVYDVNREDGETIDDILDLSGYNMGNMAAGALVQIVYQAQVSTDVAYCGKTLTNTITVNYSNDKTKSNEATATVTCADVPVAEKTCATNPEMEGCQELPNTGPLEVVLAAVIIAGIAGGGYYLYRTRKTLDTVESSVSGNHKAKTEPKVKTSQDSTSHDSDKKSAE